ncbi:hypothetical protein DIPPA_13346, partial [Diplonema papillatum]
MLALVVDWNTLPKGRRGNPFCRSKVVAIRGPLTREIAELLRGLGNFQQLCPLSTDQFSRLLGADNATKLYSAHSVKRGAIDHLMNMKAAGAPFALQLISRLAKHTNDADPTVANMTVRYTSDPVALARVLQTGDVTRGKRTRLPGTEEEKKSPLHVDSVPSMDVAVLRRRMNAPTRKRFDETWSRTFYPQTFPSKTSSPPGRSRFEAAHAFELEEHGIAERAAGPGRDMNVPFTVVEEKERKLRQRFILWTYDANRVVEADGYEAHVPLSHVSKYLHAVNRECGSTRDFSDGDGNWWQLTRLPIGHSCAPELMYTLASTTAGHPDYVDGKHAVSSEVLVHVWVDNIRYAGPRNLVLKATSYPDALAAEARITSKAADTRNAACRYEFLGVDWKHSDGTVGVSAKMQSRLQRAEESVRAGKMSAAEIKSLAGRLLHASAIAGVYVGEYYFALKFFRLTNALNRGEKCLDENVVLSHGLQRALPSWMQRVQRRRIVPVAAQSPKLAVFVDASLDGWGGVLVDVDTNDMVVVGSCWNRVEKRLHINQLEAMAFERSVKAISPAYAGSTVTVIVDNTSVQGVARKGALVVDWNTLPKGRRGNPFCRSKVVAIRGPLTREIAELLRGLGNFQQLCPLSTDQFSRLLGADNATKLYSAHSVKRGAIDHLMNMKAAGAPFALQLISRLAKHTNDADPTVAKHDGQVHVGSGGAGAGSSDRGRDKVPLRRRKSDKKRRHPPMCKHPDPDARRLVVHQHQRYSILRRGKRTRLPGTEEEKKSPLHVDSVPSMDVAVLRRRMNAPTRKRFDETWSRTFYPQTFPSKTSSPPGRSRFEAAHAFELEEHGIAERAAGPGRDMNVPFTVVEEKEGKLRQRFILWTYDANRVVEADGYEAHVPLSHVSKYLHAVNRECGSTRDFRYAGPRNLVLKATSYPDALAAEARITSKAADTRNAACRYEFLGVDWKHSDGTVGVSAKMQSRLQRAEESVRAGKMSAAEIKSLAGRLLHASAIAGVYVGEYYFALKFFRLTNALNRGEKCLDENVVLSHGLQRALPSWMQRVQRRRIVPVAAQSPKLAVFVDASLDGWGGVLVDVDTNDMVVVGSCWNRVEKRLHINQLEAMAFERSVKAISPAYAGSTVTVIVDNTSVQGVAGFDLQHLLAVLLMLESKDALSVNKAVAKVVPGFVVPPPGPRPKEDASSKSFGEATTQQQLQQILMQQQRQQEMMMQRLQQVQQELQTVKAQAAAWPPAPQQHWPEEKCRLFLRSSGRRASASRPARDFEFDEAGICWLHGGRNRRGQAAPLLVHETTAARGELAQTSDDPMERAAAKVECARAKKWECTSAIRRQRLVVDWNTLPKGRRGNPFCRSKVVAIRGPLTREIAELLRGLGNFQQLCPLSTDQFSRLLGADNATKLYSAHSVKRGAIDHLMNMKAAGAPFALQLISRLAKHTNDADPTVANMTVRYTSDPVALARVLQTGDVTRGKRTRLPGTEEEKKSPLHVDSVPSMDVAVLRRRMNAPTRKRFDETWSRTFYPQTFPSKTSSPPGRSRFEAAHAFELEEHGIAERAAGPGRDMNVPFTVVEEKERKLRQRFILWTYDANRVVEADGYEAHVPLSHVSKYLHAVNRECGSTRDFSDGDGNWWQLTRLPIGHSCAPELMYTLASTTAGHPDYVDGKHAVSSEVLVHVWVDNIRYAGPRNLVLKATSYPDALAAEARITSKAADTRNAACRYEFLGVDWKHSDGTVGVSAKMQSRLQRAEESVRAGKMSAAEIKSLAGRLLHASAIAGVYVGEYYFALKFFRLTNALNRGEKCLDENVVLSHGLQRALPSWMQRVQRRRIVPVAAQSPKLAVFVDASLDGWGGVLVDVDTNDMVVVGSCWNRVEKRLHINQLEAMAFERSVKAISPAYAGST